MSILVRPYQYHDLPALKTLIEVTHDPLFFRYKNIYKPIRDIAKTFLTTQGAFWVLEDTAQQKIVGSIGLQRRSKKLGKLKSLRIHPDYRRQGLAQRLLKKAERFACDQQLAKVYLEVSCLNLHAVMLYEKMGYTMKRIKKTKYFNNYVYEKKYELVSGLSRSFLSNPIRISIR